MPRITLPNGEVRDFPDWIPQESIDTVLSTEFPPQAPVDKSPPMLQQVLNIPNSIGRTYGAMTAQGITGAEQAFKDITGTNTPQEAIDAQRLQEITDAQLEHEFKDVVPSYIPRNVVQGTASLMGALPILAASELALPAVPVLGVAGTTAANIAARTAASVARRKLIAGAGASAMGVETGAAAYNEAKAADKTPLEASRYAGVQGLLETAGELVPLGYLTKVFGKETVKNWIWPLMGREIVSENLTSISQEIDKKIELNPDMPWIDLLKSLPQIIADTTGSTVVQTLETAGLASGINRLSKHNPANISGKKTQEVGDKYEALKTAKASGDAEAVKVAQNDLATAASNAFPEINDLIGGINQNYAPNQLPEPPDILSLAPKTVEELAVDKKAQVALSPLSPTLSNDGTHFVGLDSAANPEDAQLVNTNKVINNAENYLNNPNDGIPRSQQKVVFGPAHMVGRTLPEVAATPATITIGQPSDDRSLPIMEAYHEIIDSIRQKFTPNATIVLSNESIGSRQAVGKMAQLGSGEYLIVPAFARMFEVAGAGGRTAGTFNVSTQGKIFYNLFHEFGHVLTLERFFKGDKKLSGAVTNDVNAHGRVSPETIAMFPAQEQAVLREYNTFRDKLDKQNAAWFSHEWMSPALGMQRQLPKDKNVTWNSGAGNFVRSILTKRNPTFTRLTGRINSLKKQVAKAEGIAKEELQQALQAVSAERMQLLDKYVQRYLSFDEFMAEQMSRYAHAEKLGHDSTIAGETMLGRGLQHVANEERIRQEGLRGVMEDIQKSLKSLFIALKKGIRLPNGQVWRIQAGTSFKQWVESLNSVEHEMRAKLIKVDVLHGQTHFQEDINPEGETTPFEYEPLESVEAAGEADMENLVSILGGTMYGSLSTMPAIDVKEMLQNSVDAVRAELDVGNIKLGQIHIKISDSYDREITVTDNGQGMSAATLAGPFVTIGGSKKTAENPGGGFGFAKMVFLYGSDHIRVETVHDGIKSILDTTGKVLIRAKNGGPKAQIIRERTSAPNGTKITIKLPETYYDPTSNTTEQIHWYYKSMLLDMLNKSPLFSNINVSIEDYAGTTQVDIGANYNLKEWNMLGKVVLPFGHASLYVKPNQQQGHSTNENLIVLSNGLYQFESRIKDDPTDIWSMNSPYDFLLNLEIDKNIKATDPRYPFFIDRQGFSHAGQAAGNLLITYLSNLYQNMKSSASSESFGKLQAVTDAKQADVSLQIPKAQYGTVIELHPNDKAEIVNDKLIINNRVVPVLTKADLVAVKVDPNQFKIDQALLDPATVYLHENAQVNGESVAKLLGKKFGYDRMRRFYIDIVSHMQSVRLIAQNLFGSDYAGLNDIPMGISFDAEYRGVHVKIPFQAIMINPLFSRAMSVDTAGEYSMSTVIHEIIHYTEPNHSATGFIPELQHRMLVITRNQEFLGVLDSYEKLWRKNDDLFKYFNELQTGAVGGVLQNAGLALVGFSDTGESSSLAQRNAGYESDTVPGPGIAGVPNDVANSGRDSANGRQRSAAPATSRRAKLRNSERPAEHLARTGVAKSNLSIKQKAELLHTIDQGGEWTVLENLRDKDSETYYQLDFPPATDSAVGELKGFADVLEKYQNDARFGPALRWVQNIQWYIFQLQQLAWVHPEIHGLTTANSAASLYVALKSKLQRAGDKLARNWRYASKEVNAKTTKLMETEFKAEVHKTELMRLPDGSYRHVLTKDTLDWAKSLGIDYNTTAGKHAIKIYIDSKNILLEQLIEAQKALQTRLWREVGHMPEEFASRIQDLRETFERIRNEPFLPRANFGAFAVIIIEAEGASRKIVGRYHFETRENAKKGRELLSKHLAPNQSIHTKVIMDEHRVLMALPVEYVEHAADALGLKPEEKNILLELLTPAKSDKLLRAYDKELRRIEGGSTDRLRAFADFIWHNSTMIARLTAQPLLNQAKSQIRQQRDSIDSQEGFSEDVRLLAIETHEKALKYLENTVDYMLAPPNEWYTARSVVALAYLWGNAKTAILNVFGLMTTVTQIIAEYGPVIGGKALVKANFDLEQFIQNGGKKLHPIVQEVYNRALHEGQLEQSYAAHLAGASTAQGLLRVAPDSDKLRKIQQGFHIVAEAGMLPFSLIEQFTRRIALLANVEAEVIQAQIQKVTLAEQNINHIYELATNKLNLTQNSYSLANRVKVMRGTGGMLSGLIPMATIFLSFFQHLSFHGLGGFELGARRQASWVGKKAFKSHIPYTVQLLATLFILGGYEALPGMEDLLDVLDAIMLHINHKTFRQSIRETVQQFPKVQGADWLNDPRWWARGLGGNVSIFGTNVDVSKALGIGHIIPGMGELTGPADTPEEIFGALLPQMFGVTGSMVTWLTQLGLDLAQGNDVRNTLNRTPGVAGNIFSALDWMERGVRDRSGALMYQPTPGEAKLKALGFQPAGKSEKQEVLWAQKETILYWTTRRNLLQRHWNLAKDQGNQEGIVEIDKDIAEFNSEVPASQLRLLPYQKYQSWRQHHKQMTAKEAGKFQRNQAGLAESVGASFEDLDSSPGDEGS